MQQHKTLATRIADDDIRADVSRGNRDGHPATAFPMNDWTVVLHLEGRRLPISWWTGRGLSGTPTARDVLARLLSDAADVETGGTFEGWCARHALDTDERHQKERYQTALRQTEKLRAFLADKYESYLWDTDSEEDPAMYDAVRRGEV